MALASYPGLFTTAPPSDAAPYGVFWPSSVCAERVTQEVFLDGVRVAEVPGTTARTSAAPFRVTLPPSVAIDAVTTERVPLGRLVGARSGDKAGRANVGLWAGSDAAYAWL